MGMGSQAGYQLQSTSVSPPERERWPPPGPSLLLSFSLELPLLFRVEGTLATSNSPPATSGSCSRRLAMRLTMDRATRASISSTNGRRQGSRVDSRKEDLDTQENISQQIQHLTMTTSTCRGWTRRGRSMISCTTRGSSKSLEMDPRAQRGF